MPDNADTVQTGFPYRTSGKPDGGKGIDANPLQSGRFPWGGAFGNRRERAVVTHA